MKKSEKYLYISIITFIIWYIFLQYAFINFNNLPYVQEVILIILWTIVTIAITASLLNKQSEIEIEKEQRVKIFDIKSWFYIELINMIEKFILKQKLDRSDLLNLEFLTHKISIIADFNVLKEYSHFLSKFKEIIKNWEIDKLESNELSLQLSKLCEKIREDLLKNNNNLKNKKIKELLINNIKK